ncbi:MAG: TatD family hydrolase [Hominenteromicrobium sp.]|uniref:TatD family hydrolase n=1 Tax=Hominenteromicrobium sp. TaxID=3073581 RepID=UPI0039A050E6
MIFDSHAHYDSEQFDIDRDELLGSVLPQKGVVAVINMAADYESLKKTVALCEKYDYIYGAVGIHPECANDLPDNWLWTWKRCFPTRRSSPSARSASTTTGRTSARAKSRKKCLSPSWSSRKKHDLPVVIHDREAHGDMMDILRKYKPKGVVHCFSGSAELAQETVKLGMYIGLGGVVTFKNARHSVEVAKTIPLDRLLTETDAPYMAPVPFRGKRCDSSMIPYDAAKIAEARGITAQEVLETACENACRLFGITLPSAAK